MYNYPHNVVEQAEFANKALAEKYGDLRVEYGPDGWQFAGEESEKFLDKHFTKYYDIMPEEELTLGALLVEAYLKMAEYEREYNEYLDSCAALWEEQKGELDWPDPYAC